MILNGIIMNVKNLPSLDKGFIPFAAYKASFEISARAKGAKKLAIAIERNDNQVSLYDTHIHGTPGCFSADRLYVERMVKFLLWMKGGYKVYICGDEKIGSYIKQEYENRGERSFDHEFMENVYENPFEVISLPYEDKPAANEKFQKADMHSGGCRIGFDAGGSDRKVSAVIDGKPVYSEEVVWHPKQNSDPTYHYNGIVTALKTAAMHMPRVDAIGVSSAGIYINNFCRVASLFIKVPDEVFKKEVEDIYIRAARELGDVPVVVCNDGDVAALAGSLELGVNNILGIAMGTSEAAGFVKQGGITGWLNELAFAPVDLNAEGDIDEWSGDAGCGVKYLSQDSVVRLARKAGIDFCDTSTPAEKLKYVQDLLEKQDERSVEVFKSLGVYLGHSLALYYSMYQMEHVMLLGRVMAGKGGEIALEEAKKVLTEDYGELNGSFQLHLPDEKSRRVGQAFAAAHLPEIDIRPT